ncbi:hypothetical protein BH23GEM6_BH23GEM6_00910 [soil metagenome]
MWLLCTSRAPHFPSQRVHSQGDATRQRSSGHPYAGGTLGVIGLAAAPLFAYSARAAAGRLAGDPYINAMLGTERIVFPSDLHLEAFP